MKILSVENLKYEYHDRTPALRGVSFSVEEGEKIALIGPNGAGKSTLLLHLNGVLRGEGKIVAAGIELSEKNLKQIRKVVGVIFQDPNDQLFCPTVRDDVSFGPMHFNLSEQEIDEIVVRTLAEVGLGDISNRPSHHLSLGEKRRVTIAAVLACNPDIIAMDEPAAMLDPKRRRWLIDFLKQERRTILLATHDLHFAKETCSRVIVMSGGKIVADGASDDILHNKKLLESCELESL